MTWWNIVKLKKYTTEDVKRLFLNEHTIRTFKHDNTLIEQHLFFLIYFNKPLPSKVRIECMRFASKTSDVKASKFLHNLSVAGERIIESDRVLPFSMEEVSAFGIQRDRRALLAKPSVEMKIWLLDTDIYYIDLRMYDGLYSFELRRVRRVSSTVQPSSLESNIPFIKKVLDEYNPLVKIYEHGNPSSSFFKPNTNLEEVIDHIEYLMEEL